MRSTPRIFTMVVISAIFTLFHLSAATAHAQKKSGLNTYRGLEIGMTKDQAREKLGKVKDEFSDEDDFEISNNESARVFYTPDKTVKAMVITYSGKIETAPKPKAVVGEDIEAKPDGGMYKMVRFEDEGFWVSYVKTAGDNPSVIITLQQLPKQSE